jgi:flagellar motor protein MotB
MSLRKLLVLFSLLLPSLATSCTTRYQDMLKERDERIRALNGDLARLKNENDELSRRASTPQPVNASVGDKTDANDLVDDVRRDVDGGPGVSVYSEGGRIRIGVEDSVAFDSGSTALKDSSHRVLRNIAKVLNDRFAGKRFFIEGHTDGDPIVRTKDKYRSNRHLSVERADAVARYLTQQGVSEQDIVIVGYGQFKPRDPQQKAKNRRVEIVVTER